jgi:hypothetical protein
MVERMSQLRITTRYPQMVLDLLVRQGSIRPRDAQEAEGSAEEIRVYYPDDALLADLKMWLELVKLCEVIEDYDLDTTYHKPGAWSTSQRKP